MIGRFLDTMHRRDSGFLVRRYISFSGHIVAMAIMIILTYKGQLTEGYFGIYVSFVAAHASMEKFIAHRPNKGPAIYTGPDDINHGDEDSDGDYGYQPHTPTQPKTAKPNKPTNRPRRMPSPPPSSFEGRSAKPEDEE